jgi:hypothetical protein
VEWLKWYEHKPSKHEALSSHPSLKTKTKSSQVFKNPGCYKCSRRKIKSKPFVCQCLEKSTEVFFLTSCLLLMWQHKNKEKLGFRLVSGSSGKVPA